MIEEFETILREAYKSVEDSLALEDAGWVKLSTQVGSNILSDADRKLSVQRARIYAIKDPLGRQSIRLWTDYTFGTGMTWNSKEEVAKEALSLFWDAPQNRSVLSARGQRTSSDKLLIDGEIFFAIFLGSRGAVTIRRIDPLEITEIVTDPDDLEDVRYYKREWSDTQGKQNTTYYKSLNNMDDKSVKDKVGAEVRATDDAIVYHLAINTIGQRGNSTLFPALDWIKLYRQFLASRVAIMLALARFAWKVKVKGGQPAVDAAKATFEGERPAAGAMLVENLGVDSTPIRTDSGARNAYDDGRMIKLQVAAAVGIPEQYFGDISIGNLATAKTVELPMIKMFQSYQQIWSDAYDEIDQLVLEHAGVAEDKRYVDRDFPGITPEDASELAKSLQALLMVFPDFATNRDVMQQGLMAIGVHNTNEVLDVILGKGGQESHMIALTKALRRFQEVIIRGNGKVS